MKFVWYTAALLLLSNTAAHAFTTGPRSAAAAGTRTTTALGLFGFLNQGKKLLVKQLAGDYDAAAIQSRLDNLIAKNKVLMLSFTTCPFCIKAKGILDSKKVKYTVVELDQDPDGKAIRAVMGETLGRTSVPAVWIAGQFVGGCNDGPMGGVVPLNESGELDTLLRKAKAL